MVFVGVYSIKIVKTNVQYRLALFFSDTLSLLYVGPRYSFMIVIDMYLDK